MVEYTYQIDQLFFALSDSTRRNILEHVATAEMSIGEIARHYQLTFAGISKHIKVLERAGLVIKKRRGKEQVVILVPESVEIAREHVERYACMWNERYNKLEAILKEKEL